MTDAALYAMPRFEACLRNSEVRYSDKWSEITQIMNQRWLLITAVAVMVTLPSLAQETGLSVSFLFAFTSCSLIWAQELAVIQWRYREENVEFTNRFNSKFSSYPRIFTKVYTYNFGMFIGSIPCFHNWIHPRSHRHSNIVIGI